MKILFFGLLRSNFKSYGQINALCAHNAHQHAFNHMIAFHDQGYDATMVKLPPIFKKLSLIVLLFP